MNITSGKDLIEINASKNLKVWEIMLEFESSRYDIEKNYILAQMKNSLKVMKDSVKTAMNSKIENKGKIIGNDSKKIFEYTKNNKSVCGDTMSKAIAIALGVMEVNASMGKIVATPTAGSCGILPATFFTIKDSHNLKEEKLIEGLLAAGAVGFIISKNACISGAEGGCQAEVGSASAMASAAIVEMLGGSVVQALNASAICLKNLMGLVCDPIAGLVEAPCAKRNAIGTANALISAEMALSGIESVIPFDEVVVAMHSVGKMLPCALRETADGGLATTPTGIKLMKSIFQ